MFVSDRPYNAKATADACRQFLLLYSSLGGGPNWKVKPKFHMVQEMTEYQAVDMDMSPADFWAYRDEDFVGWVATFAGSRGGANNAGSASLRTIQRYRAWVQELSQNQ